MKRKEVHPFYRVGKPISDLEYPAITICSQGMISKVLSNALEYQKAQFAEAKGVEDPHSEALEKLWKETLYPGLAMTPGQLVKLAASPNPEVTVQSQVYIFF